MSAERHVVVIGLLLSAGLAIAVTASDGVSGETLEPQRVLVADLFGQPAAIAYREGRIYVLDPYEGVIWDVDRDGGDTAVIDLATPQPSHFFLDRDGAIWVVDPHEPALTVREPGQSRWRRHDLAYRAFYGAADRHGIAVDAGRGPTGKLVMLVSSAGDTVHHGQRLQHAHPYRSVANNLNWSRLALADELLVVGHIAIGRLQVLDRTSGERLTTISLAGPEARVMRQVYLYSQGLTPAETLAVAPDTLVADLVRAARPRQFPVPVYVADLAIARGRIVVLCSNVLLVYRADGVLLRRYRIGGQRDGQLVVIHGFCFDDAGHLLGIDQVHYGKLYDFGSLTLDAACPQRTGTGDDDHVQEEVLN